MKSKYQCFIFTMSGITEVLQVTFWITEYYN